MDHNDQCRVHRAVFRNSINDLKKLIDVEKRKLTCKNSRGETPLMMSIARSRSESITLYMLMSGADPKTVDHRKRNALHAAVENRASQTVVLELLNAGIDVNARDSQGRTALHHSIMNGIESTATLLCHGADVTVQCSRGYTALFDALSSGVYETADLLIDYYCTEDLGVAVNNYFQDIGNWVILKFVLKLKSSKIFKAIWKVLDSSYLKYTMPNFIVIFLNQCSFETDEWMESLLMILDSDVATDLVRHNSPNCVGFDFRSLYRAFYERSIDVDNRIMLITVFFMLGAEVHSENLRDTLNVYSCGPELECFLYAIGCKPLDVVAHPIYYRLVNLGSNYNNKQLQLHFFAEQIQSVLYVDVPVLNNSILNNMRYFALSPLLKEALVRISSEVHLNCNDIEHRLRSMPTVPSLMELSRNKARNKIVTHYRLKYPYQVLDVVKKLQIPEVIKDILLFKKPLY